MNQFSDHPLYKQHSIDSAMNSIWEYYRKNFVLLFVVSFVMSIAIQYASSMVDMKELSTITDPMLMLEKLKGLIVPIIVVSLVNLLFTNILQYYILYNPIDSSNTFLSSVVRSLKYFIPYLIIMILLAFAGSIAILVGFLALVIGAFFAILYIVTLYLFILPVMMAEGINIGSVISRSFSLTHRNFWSNIGWVAVFIILLLVISVIFSGIILLPFSGSFIKTIINPQDATQMFDVAKKPLFIILSAAVSALTMPLMPIFACVLYFNGLASENKTIVTEDKPEEDTRLKVEDLYAKPYSDDHPDNPENKI